LVPVINSRHTISESSDNEDGTLEDFEDSMQEAGAGTSSDVPVPVDKENTTVRASNWSHYSVGMLQTPKPALLKGKVVQASISGSEIDST
jgi:hypothetical protein